MGSVPFLSRSRLWWLVRHSAKLQILPSSAADCGGWQNDLRKMWCVLFTFMKTKGTGAYPRWVRSSALRFTKKRGTDVVVALSLGFSQKKMNRMENIILSFSISLDTGIFDLRWGKIYLLHPGDQLTWSGMDHWVSEMDYLEGLSEKKIIRKVVGTIYFIIASEEKSIPQRPKTPDFMRVCVFYCPFARPISLFSFFGLWDKLFSYKSFHLFRNAVSSFHPKFF